MITEKQECGRCGSPEIVKNGKRANGQQKYECKACGKYGTLNPKMKYTAEQKEQIMKMYKERGSMRGVERVFGVSRVTLSVWLKKEQKK